MKKLRRKKKKVINDAGDKMSEDGVKKIQGLAASIANQAMKVGAEIYPEDEFLLYLASEKAVSPESAIAVPDGFEARMYTLWTEDFVGHVGDKVYLTKKGRYVVEILKLKLRGDSRWKKYK
jgi:hypothetical protein